MEEKGSDTGGATARRWVSNSAAMALAIACVLPLLDEPRGYQPMPRILADRLKAALRDWSVSASAGLLERLGTDCRVGGQMLAMEDESGGLVIPLTTVTAAVDGIDTLVLLLVVAAGVAGSVWAVGRTRKLLLIVVAALLPPLLLPILVGLVNGVLFGLFGDKSRVAPHGWITYAPRFAQYATVGLTVVALWGVKAIVQSDEPDEPPVDVPPDPPVRPPLLWGAVVLGFAVVLVELTGASGHLGIEGVIQPTNPVRLLLVACAATALLLVLLRQAWAAKALPVALGLLLLAGPRMVYSLLLVWSVVALHDLRAAALTGKPLGEAEAARLRTLRPLTPLVWILTAASALGSAGTVLSSVMLVRFPLATAIGRYHLPVILAGCGVALAGWEIVALRRSGLHRATRPLKAALPVAAVVLVLAPVASWASSRLRSMAARGPVPWPAGVEVDEGFRMTSLPDRMGPYELVTDDGEIYQSNGRPMTDGQPDGVPSMPEDVMELLKIGTASDVKRLPDRRSNWYCVRIYRDGRLPLRDPLRYWRLEVYSYTGGVDLVPYVPEMCAVSGGATHVRTDDFPIRAEDLPGVWGAEPIPFRRALFQVENLARTRTSWFVQYRTFSLNGRPESRRSAVRLKLANPFVRHACFARIQLAPVPVHAVPDPKAADEAVGEFAHHVLPHVLKALPTPEDIERLDKAE